MVVQCIWGGRDFNAARNFEGSGGKIHLCICSLDKTGSFMSVFQLGFYRVAPKGVGVAPDMCSDTARGTLAGRVFELGQLGVCERSRQKYLRTFTFKINMNCLGSKRRCAKNV